MILELHRQGVSVSAIARRVALDRKTVRRCGGRSGWETLGSATPFPAR